MLAHQTHICPLFIVENIEDVWFWAVASISQDRGRRVLRGVCGVVKVVVVRAAKSQGLRLKGVSYIFYKALCIDVRKIKDKGNKS